MHAAAVSPEVSMSAPDADRLACENAPRLLAEPDARVVTCVEVPALPGLWNITLERPDGSRTGAIVPTDTEGHLDKARGPAAATAYLRRRGAFTDPAVGMTQVMLVLKAYDAIPAPLTFDSQDTNLPAGKSALRASPWQLVLLQDLTTYAGTPSSARRVARGTLDERDGRMTWTMEEWKGAGWLVTATVPAEGS